MKLMSLILVLIYAGVFCLLDEQQSYQLFSTFGLSYDGLKQGRVWQLVTYALLHGNWFHVLLNATFLYLLGRKAPAVFGSVKSYWILLLGIIGGGLFHLLIGLFVESHSGVILVGVSGGVMAILLALTTYSPYERLSPLPLRSGNLGLGCLLAAFLLLLIDPAVGMPAFSTVGEKIEVLAGFDLSRISNACHLGGGFAGWVFVKYFTR